jgi:hypothetical protein
LEHPVPNLEHLVKKYNTAVTNLKLAKNAVPSLEQGSRNCGTPVSKSQSFVPQLQTMIVQLFCFVPILEQCQLNSETHVPNWEHRCSNMTGARRMDVGQQQMSPRGHRYWEHSGLWAGRT